MTKDELVALLLTSVDGFNQWRIVNPRTKINCFSLEEASFVGANLRGANFEGVNLRGANFEKADLRDTIFNGADTRRANFRGARIIIGNQVVVIQQ